MTENEIKLFVNQQTEETLDKRWRKLLRRGAFVTSLILPLAYFGIEALAKKAANDSAAKALGNQQQAWAAIYSQIAKTAVDSANSAEAASRSAANASLRAEGAADKLESAAANISKTLGFKSREDVINAIVASADIRTSVPLALQIRIGNCRRVEGSCGSGTYNRPTYYLDRVEFSCPSERPLLSEIRFKRCGPIGQSDEGLLLSASCCALSLGE